MNATPGGSVDYRHPNAEFPYVPTRSGRVCACGEVPGFKVTITEPLVSTMGPEPVCAECMPGMTLAADRLAAVNPKLLVLVTAWDRS